MNRRSFSPVGRPTSTKCPNAANGSGAASPTSEPKRRPSPRNSTSSTHGSRCWKPRWPRPKQNSFGCSRHARQGRRHSPPAAPAAPGRGQDHGIDRHVVADRGARLPDLDHRGQPLLWALAGVGCAPQGRQMLSAGAPAAHRWPLRRRGVRVRHLRRQVPTAAAGGQGHPPQQLIRHRAGGAGRHRRRARAWISSRTCLGPRHRHLRAAAPCG